MPLLVGGLLVLLSVLLTIDVLRGGKGEAESGDDIDLAHPADKRTVGLLAGVILATAVLIPWIGWPLAGAGLFWGATYALGSRAIPWLRTLAAAAGASDQASARSRGRPLTISEGVRPAWAFSPLKASNATAASE